MARWKLMKAHYIRVGDPSDTQWEYVETTHTGKKGRHIFDVPRYLDPDAPGDKNDGDDVVVCLPGKGERKDYVWPGPPTPDMEPLDEEAEKITAEMKQQWLHPIESLPVTDNQSLLAAEQTSLRPNPRPSPGLRRI